MADRDGVVVIPEKYAEEVIAKTEEVLKTESLVRKAIMEWGGSTRSVFEVWKILID